MKTSGRGSRKSLAFTPQPTKQNDSKSRRSVSSLNLEDGERNSNDTLFDTLMSDPIKRTMIMKLLSQEKDNIEKYKQNEDKKNVTRLKRNERLLHCESPTALLRRRALEKNRRDSDSSSTTSDSRSTSITPVPFELLLSGVVAYVEIRSKEGDRSAGAKALMQAMGATVKDYFTTDVTHVVFKDGSFTTYQKAKLKKVHLVSVLWLEAVRKNNFLVSEKNYPALGTEAFDVNISQICSDYEKVVNEERRRSQAIGLPSPFSGCIKSRKTALPSELKSVQYDGTRPSPVIGARLSEVVIPTSQDWEAESVISCASGTLPFRRTTPTAQEEGSERFGVSTPELTSDNDSDCGVIDGHSFKRDSLELDKLEKVRNEPELGNANALCIPESSGVNNVSVNTSNNTSSTRSASLLSRKSEPHRKSSYQVVDMDLTNTGIENLNKVGEVPGTNLRQTRNIYNAKSDLFSLPPNDKIFKEPYVNVGNINKKIYSTDDLSIVNSSNRTSNSTRATRSTSDLIGKKKYSVSSDETPSLRFSTSSKDTTDQKNDSRSIRKSDGSNGQTNQDKDPSNTEEMPSLRISTSISSNDASNKRHSAQISGEVVETQSGRQSSHSEEMPSLRISSSCSANDSAGKKKSKKTKSGSLDSEAMPSLRISNSSTDISGQMKTRSSMSCQSTLSVDGKNKTKDARNSSSNNDASEKKKRESKSPPQIEPEGQKGQKDENSEDTSAVKKKRKSDQNESCNTKDTKGKKRKASGSKGIEVVEEDQNNQDEVQEKSKKNNIISSRSLRSRTSGPLTSEDMSSLRISNDIAEKPPEAVAKLPQDQNLEDSTENGKNVSSSRRVHSSRDAKKQADLKSTSPMSTRSSSSFKSKEFTPIDESVVTEIISSLESPKTCDNRSNISNKKDNKGENKSSKKKQFRKLYNLNQSVEETLKNFEWDDNNKDDAPTTEASKNVVPKKTFTVPLVPIPVTPIAKQLLEKSKLKRTQATKEKVAKKDPPKPQKKVCLDSSKDEQKELAEEYVTKTTKRKIVADGESQPENKRAARISRRSQRLSQYQKRDYTEVSNTDSNGEEPIVPQLNRRSTFDFVQASPTKTQKARNRKKKSSIVCTRMHRPEVQTFVQVVRKLGHFFVQDEVTDKTTHLVVGEPKRTINLLKALARGCWILKQEWLFRSLEAEKWLPEEDFEVTDFSPAVQQCRTERRAFGSLYSMDIFENCGPIYIARSSIPRRSDLQELVQLCKGTITNIAFNASVVVGDWVRYENVKCVTEMWLLDSITFNSRKSFKNYLMKRDR